MNDVDFLNLIQENDWCSVCRERVGVRKTEMKRFNVCATATFDFEIGVDASDEDEALHEADKIISTNPLYAVRSGDVVAVESEVIECWELEDE